MCRSTSSHLQYSHVWSPLLFSVYIGSFSNEFRQLSEMCIILWIITSWACNNFRCIYLTWTNARWLSMSLTHTHTFLSKLVVLNIIFVAKLYILSHKNTTKIAGKILSYYSNHYRTWHPQWRYLRKHCHLVAKKLLSVSNVFLYLMPNDIVCLDEVMLKSQR